MKYVVIICFCLISASQQITDEMANPEFYQKVVDSAEECVKLNNVNKADLENIFDDKFEVSDNLKCYVQCILEKTEIMSSNGDIEESKLRESFPLTFDDKKKDDIIDKCAKQTFDNPCETAYNLAKCCESYE